MWRSGKFTIDGVKCRYEARVYDPGSTDGIDGSRVSHLWIVANDTVAIVNYDKGWVVEPKDETSLKALNYVLRLYRN